MGDEVARDEAAAARWKARAEALAAASKSE